MPRYEREPHDELTEVGDEMIKRMLDCIERPIWAIVMLSDGEGGAVAMHGYEQPLDAFPDIIVHLDQIAKVEGKRVRVFPFPKRPVDNDPESS